MEVDFDEIGSMRHSTIPRSFKSLLTAMGSALKANKGKQSRKFSSMFDGGDEYALDRERLKIFIGTWNMYGKVGLSARLLEAPLLTHCQPPPQDLAPFIEQPEHANPSITPYLNCRDEHPYHLLVIGTQECQRPISESVLFPSKEEWEKQLEEVLSPQYVLVKSETMAALHLAVFVWKDCRHWIKARHSAQVATGIGGIIGNKGGVGISILFGATSLLFVNSHFTAHQSRVSYRNYDYKRIDRELKLPGYKKADTAPSSLASERFDYTFWFGDLNYRVNGDRATIDRKISEGDMDYLLENDQLNIQRQCLNVFQGFQEAPIHFPPTYKFDVPSLPTADYSRTIYDFIQPNNVYDTSPKARVPSWTDRILYKARKGVVDVARYEAVMEMYGSDHKPVVGIFLAEFNWKKELAKELKSCFKSGTIAQTIEQQRDLMLAKLAKEQYAPCKMQ
ncbi:DNase I-like protein [Basidiobolus meristosporus CBS 931.73]|uniref:DNase I-like protein n=1 Tax=Basidiobolus meristosporus CBS 931.73 TaxID=1314790 RepID=A0A1Y1XZ71_9FUNG|nr:DNase I-like protein [Basidiobolus meristosporus CBS 931.73]|eukprot:ORX91022.1 DNase I-like protein [Basidiobolus meristosporus CBS 931.73]